MNFLRKATIKWKARRILAKLGIERPPVDAEAVANALGFKVVHATLNGDDMANVLGFSNPEDKTIYVTKATSFGDRQKTIAVEIGKALLHEEWWRDAKRYRLRTSNSPKCAEEVEAEWFALNLLVPHRWVEDLQRYATMRELEKVFITDRKHIVGALAKRVPH
jgi:Zn-dependent peptidase ImmA (M78 family)